MIMRKHFISGEKPNKEVSSKMGLFISHCSDDFDIMKHFSKLIDNHYSGYTIHNTFDAKHGTYAGEDRSNTLRQRLQDSSVLIAIITDSYLRSPICISELSSFWYSNKTVVPIIFNGETGIEFLTELIGRDIIYIDTQSKNENFGYLFCDALKQAAFDISKSLRTEAERQFDDFFRYSKQSFSERKYIGMAQDIWRIVDYCEQFGIRKFQNKTMSTSEIIQRLDNKDEIILLSTTGSNLIRALSSEFLPHALKCGCDITVLLPNRCSQFVIDVAEIEMPDSVESNIERLNDEFKAVIFSLVDAATRASNNSDSEKIGKVFVGNASTLLRQTVVAGKKDDNVWGWASLTIPPKRTNDGTPSFEFDGSVNNKCMSKIMWQHLIAIKKIAAKRNAMLELMPNTDIKRFSFGLERMTAKKAWEEFYDNAKRNAEYHQKCFDKVLIEVAAQHPLNPDGTPMKEFAARLDTAVELYGKMKAAGTETKIFVPGSIHRYEGITDPVSLSDSGVAYLTAKGVDPHDLLGRNEIEKYKETAGVYDSADECFVASEIYKNDGFKVLYCVCSPNQLVRKQLFYTAFGVVPFMISVPCDEMAHNMIYELFETIPDVILHDHTWQEENSIQGNRTRKERNPAL